MGDAMGLTTGCYSSRDAKRAVSILLGDATLRAAVDWYVERRPHAELARMVLWQLKPAAARARCMEIYRSDADVDDRRGAVELFRVVATAESLPLIADFLADPDPAIQLWGIGVLDQMLFNDELDDENDAEPYLRLAERHPNPAVQEKVAFIRGRAGAAERAAVVERVFDE
jgi:HEAT repeat protein